MSNHKWSKDPATSDTNKKQICEKCFTKKEWCYEKGSTGWKYTKITSSISAIGEHLLNSRTIWVRPDCSFS